MKAKTVSKQSPSEYLKAVVPQLEVSSDLGSRRVKLLSVKEFAKLAERVRKSFKNNESPLRSDIG